MDDWSWIRQKVGATKGVKCGIQWFRRLCIQVLELTVWASGDAERFLEESANMDQPILWATLAAREKVVARGVATALRALVGGKALSCIRHHPEKHNGFEMWGLHYKEYMPHTATRKVGLLEVAMDDQPAPGVDFSDRFIRWLDLVGECEQSTWSHD